MPSNSVGHGGDIEWLGIQARLALTDRWSIIVSKLGYIWDQVHPPAVPGLVSASGFSEFDIGAQYTFIRSEETGTVGAAGLTFQIPTGPVQVFQDTGPLSMVPYVTMGQNFGKSSYGSFNVLGTIGYAASVDNKRSEYLFSGIHLDYDIANAHKYYPLIELNWTHYTVNGETRALSFEGGDLFNLGSNQVAGHNNLTLAVGGRYKMSEAVQFGSAIEFPVATRDTARLPVDH